MFNELDTWIYLLSTYWIGETSMTTLEEDSVAHPIKHTFLFKEIIKNEALS